MLVATFHRSEFGLSLSDDVAHYLLMFKILRFGMQNPATNFGFGRDVKLLISSVGIVSLAGGFCTGSAANLLSYARGSTSSDWPCSFSSPSCKRPKNGFLWVLSDKMGRRKILFVIFMTSVIYNLIYFFAKDYSLFILAAIIGGAGGEGFGGHAEGSLLSEKAGNSRRTLVFSIQYFVSSGFSTIGSFASSFPEVISQSFGVQIFDAIRLIFAFQAILVLLSAILVLFISEDSHPISREENALPI